MSDRTGITEITAPIAAGSAETPLAVHFANEQQGGFKFFTSEAERDAFTAKFKPRLYRSLAIIADSNSDYVDIYRWTGLDPNGTDGAWKETDLSSFLGMSFVNADGSTTTGIQVLSLAGLELTGNEKDGFTLSVSGGKLKISKTSDTGPSTYSVNEIKFDDPIEVVPDQSNPGDEVKSVIVRVKPGTYAPMNAPGYLAYLQYPVEVVGKHTQAEKVHKGALWFDMVAVDPSPYIEINRDKKSFGLQDYTSDDPNVTGGVSFLVWPFVYLDGKAPNDGFVELVMYDRESGEVVTDVNGHAIAVRHNYKAGDDLTPSHEPIMFTAVVNAKGLKDYGVAMWDSFENDVLKLKDYSEGPSGICIQALTTKGTTSEALIKAEVDTGLSVRPESYYVGPYFASFGYFLSIDEPQTTLNKGEFFRSVDGVELFACESLSVSVNSGALITQCPDGTICDFYIAEIIGPEITRLIAGKEISIDMAIEDKDSGWKVGYFNYSGDLDKIPPIFNARNNGSIVLNSGWSEWGAGFISEDAVSGLHSAQFATTIPIDATYAAIAVYPVSAQSPMTLRLRKLVLSMVTPFTGYEINKIDIRGLQHLDFINRTVILNQSLDNNYSELRYTIGDSPEGNPMPLGEPDRPLKYSHLDKTKNVITGSQADGGEGALVADSEFSLTIYQRWQLYNEQKTDSQTSFWLMLHSADTGQDTEIPGSRTTFDVSPGRPGIDYFKTNKITVELQAGDYVYARAKSSVPDGSYAQTSDKASPLCITYVTEKGLNN